MKKTLVFVYNAKSGLFDKLTDYAHKLFSPKTYACNLCAITYSDFGMRAEWQAFLDTLEAHLEFMYKDQIKARYGIEDIELPAVFWGEEERLELLIDSVSINSCKSIDDLKQLILSKLV